MIHVTIIEGRPGETKNIVTAILFKQVLLHSPGAKKNPRLLQTRDKILSTAYFNNYTIFRSIRGPYGCYQIESEHHAYHS